MSEKGIAEEAKTRRDLEHEHVHEHDHENGHEHVHEHVHEHGHDHEHDNCESHHHGHYHSPEVKKKELARISRAIGHLQHVKLMMENDEDCADVLIQLSAVRSAITGLGKEIINEHITHCISHAMEDGDDTAIEEFKKAIEKFL